MRTYLLVFLLLCSCSDSPEQAAEWTADPAEVARLKAEYEQEQARFAAIEYPACENVWAGEKLGSCGRQVLKVALTTCQDTFGSGHAWIDEYTGDSWQMRAGYAARSVEERLTDMNRRDGPNYAESFAYAKGNGTNEIGRVICMLSPEMRLTDVI